MMKIKDAAQPENENFSFALSLDLTSNYTNIKGRVKAMKDAMTEFKVKTYNIAKQKESLNSSKNINYLRMNMFTMLDLKFYIITIFF